LVTITLPSENPDTLSGETSAPELEVHGVWHRSIIEVVKVAVQDSKSQGFHYTPYKEYWKPRSGSPLEQVYSEIYTADAFWEEHQNIQRLPKEPSAEFERSIVALMLWSDSTHLASFGTASAWPIYLFFGNQSKYSRGKPSKFASHHLAYMPTVRCNPSNGLTKFYHVSISSPLKLRTYTKVYLIYQPVPLS
jgi:hypothetical protein